MRSGGLWMEPTVSFVVLALLSPPVPSSPVLLPTMDCLYLIGNCYVLLDLEKT